MIRENFFIFFCPKKTGDAFVFSKIQLKLSTKQKLKIDVAGWANNSDKYDIKTVLRADWADKPFGKRTSGQGSCQVQGWLLRRDEGTITEILQPQTHHTQLTFISCPAPTHFPGSGSCWFCLNLCPLLFGFWQIQPFCPITIKIHQESH